MFRLWRLWGMQITQYSLCFITPGRHGNPSHWFLKLPILSEGTQSEVGTLSQHKPDALQYVLPFWGHSLTSNSHLSHDGYSMNMHVITVDQGLKQLLLLFWGYHPHRQEMPLQTYCIFQEKKSNLSMPIF